MSRILIDVDEDTLAEAAKALGTTTKVATVNEALRQAAARSHARQAGHRLLRRLASNPDFADPGVMHGTRCHADYEAPDEAHDPGCEKYIDQNPAT